MAWNSYLGGSGAGALGALLGSGGGAGQWTSTSVSSYQAEYMRMLSAYERQKETKPEKTKKYQFRGEFAWLRERVEEVCWKPSV